MEQTVQELHDIAAQPTTTIKCGESVCVRWFNRSYDNKDGDTLDGRIMQVIGIVKRFTLDPDLVVLDVGEGIEYIAEIKFIIKVF